MSFFATRRTGEIVSRFTDANSIIDALASTILSIFLDVDDFDYLAGLVFTKYDALFISLLALPIYTVIIFAFMKPFEKMNRDTMEANAVLSSSIIEDINGIETIKSLTSESSRYQKIDKEFVAYLKNLLPIVGQKASKGTEKSCPAPAQCCRSLAGSYSGHGWGK